MYKYQIRVCGSQGAAKEFIQHFIEGEIHCNIIGDWKITGLYDPYSKEDAYQDLPIYKIPPPPTKDLHFYIAAANPNLRQKIYNELDPTNEFHYLFPSFVPKWEQGKKQRVLSSHNQTLYYGSIIYPFTSITEPTRIGKFLHMNLFASIGHDCTIGDFVTLFPGARVGGGCKIGNCVSIGQNACIRENLIIADNTTIGQGSCIIKDITEPNQCWAGNPARFIK